MAFQIKWSPQATQDLYDLTAFIAQDDPDAAERFGLSLIEKVSGLSEHPLMGRMVPERRDPKIRELIHSPYRIVYRVKQQERCVELLRFLHAARGEPEI